MFGDKAREIDALKVSLRHAQLGRDSEKANAHDALREVDLLKVKNAELRMKLAELQPKFDHIVIHLTTTRKDLWVPEFNGGEIVEELHRQLRTPADVIGVSTDDEDFVFLASDFQSVRVAYGVRQPSYEGAR